MTDGTNTQTNIDGLLARRQEELQLLAELARARADSDDASERLRRGIVSAFEAGIDRGAIAQAAGMTTAAVYKRMDVHRGRGRR